MISCVMSGAAALLLTEYPVPKLPLVVWHGINDDCSGFAGDLIRQIRYIPGFEDRYVHCVRIADNDDADRRSSIFTDPSEQVTIACRRVAKDANLRSGFNALGISQGGLLLRALIQRCPPSQVNNVITFSSPHQGIFGIPKCYHLLSDASCTLLTQMLGLTPYSRIVQRMLAPIQYWHDPIHEQIFRQRSVFLARYNNENAEYFNERFKRNFLKVNKLLLVRNLDDDMLVPRESAHFAFYLEGTTNFVVNYTRTRLYNDDLIGLRQLIDAGRVEFQEIPGKHMHYKWHWLKDVVLKYFLD